MGRYASGSELILKEGVCTSNGAAGGTTLVDASLIGKPDFPTGLQVRILSGTHQLITRTIESFNTVTGTITIPAANPFPGQILLGTGYVIMGVTASSLEGLVAIGILSPADGTTTNAGAGGLTVIDTTRTEGLDYWKSQTLMITSGACDGQVREITAYNNATQTFTVSPAFSSNILSGVTYRVLSQLPADIDITALQADVGDASASAMGSLYGILGNPAQTFNTMVGYEGASSLAAKLTAARAAYIDILNSNDKFILTNAITGEVAFSLSDILKVSAAEKLKNFIAKTGGTEVPAGASLYGELGGAGFVTATDSLHAAAVELDTVLDLTRLYGAIACSAVETSLFIDDAPARGTMGRSVKVDLTNVSAGDTYILREYYRLTNGGAYIKTSNDATNTYVGAQTPVIKVVELEPYLYGCKVTAIKTAGTDRTINYEAFIEI